MLGKLGKCCASWWEGELVFLGPQHVATNTFTTTWAYMTAYMARDTVAPIYTHMGLCSVAPMYVASIYVALVWWSSVCDPKYLFGSYKKCPIVG